MFNDSHKTKKKRIVVISLSHPSIFYVQRALSRKGSNRMERRSGEEQEQDDLVKKLIIKGNKLLFFSEFFFFVKKVIVSVILNFSLCIPKTKQLILCLDQLKP